MTTKSQEAFEALYDTRFNCRKDDDGGYTYSDCTDAFGYFDGAWEASRKQALEDVANGFIKQKSWTQDMAHAVVQHAATEGALK